MTSSPLLKVAALTVLGRELHVGTAGAIGLALAYPLLVGCAGVLLSGERPRLRRLVSQLAALR